MPEPRGLKPENHPEENLPPGNPEASRREISTKEEADRILDMDPKELADFFSGMQRSGDLQVFLESAAENPTLVAQFSYWEKWLERDGRKLVDQTVAEKRKIYEGQEDTESLPLHLEERFTPEELSLIFSATGAIQLTFGCSQSCPFCAFDAVPGKREHIPYSQLANLFQKHGQSLATREPILYWASEPSDYASKMGLEDKTYQDVHQLAIEYAGYPPHVTSRESSDDGWLTFLKTKVNYPRVSAYGYPQERFEEILEKAEGEITVERGWSGGEHIKGIGVSSLNFDVEGVKNGIGCIDGILLTPRGLYNVVRLPISKEFPQGQIIMPLESISQEELKPGDNLKDVLRTSVVANYYSVGQTMYDELDAFERKPFERSVKIKTKNKVYYVWYDEGGIIKKTEEANLEEDEDNRIKMIKERKAEKQRAEEDKEKYKDRIQELAERKKRYMDFLAKDRKERKDGMTKYYKSEDNKKTSQELHDAIMKAVEIGVVEGWTRLSPSEQKRWLHEEWSGYKHSKLVIDDVLADHILRSRNSERIVGMNISGITVKYDKWNQEVTLAAIDRPT